MEKLTLNSECMTEVREAVDLKLDQLVRRMIARDSIDGQITLKMDVILDDRNGMIIPDIIFKVTTQMTERFEEKGKAQLQNKQLVWNDSIKEWIVERIPDPQVSMF